MHQTSTRQSPAHLNQSRPLSVMEKTTAMEKHLLHPVLQNALASLDVQLEHELIRYRRQRALGKASYVPRPIAQRHVSKVLDLMPTASTQEPLPLTSAATVSGFHPTASVPPLATIATSPSPHTSANSSLELRQLAEQYASQVAETSDLEASANGSPDDYLESSEELLRTLSQEEAQVQAEQGFMQSLLTPLGVGSMLLLLMSSALFGFVIMNPSGITQLLSRQNSQSSTPAHSDATISPEVTGNQAPQPNLADQEFPELSLGRLGSIIPEQSAGIRGPAIASPAKGQGAVKSTNLGMGGITNGLGTSTQVPSGLGQPQLEAPSSSPAGDLPSPRKLAPAAPYNPPASRTAPAQSYNSPPARSYSPPPAKAYNSPPARSYSPPPARSYNPPPAKPVPVAPKVNVAPMPLRDRTPLPPAPSPAATAPAPTSNSSGYKVVTPYTSDRALEDYRGKVPDAYVKNYSDGAKVQFGAYQDESAAKSQAEELRKQGIPAEVYKP